MDIYQVYSVTCYDEMFADDKVDTDIIHNLDTFLVCIDGAVASVSVHTNTVMIHCDITTNISHTITTNISFLTEPSLINKPKYSFTAKYLVN